MIRQPLIIQMSALPRDFKRLFTFLKLVCNSPYTSKKVIISSDRVIIASERVIKTSDRVMIAGSRVIIASDNWMSDKLQRLVTGKMSGPISCN